MSVASEAIVREFDTLPLKDKEDVARYCAAAFTGGHSAPQFLGIDPISDVEQSLLEKRVHLTNRLVAALFGIDKTNAIRTIAHLISLEQLERVVEFISKQWGDEVD